MGTPCPEEPVRALSGLGHSQCRSWQSQQDFPGSAALRASPRGEPGADQPFVAWEWSLLKTGQETPGCGLSRNSTESQDALGWEGS